VESQSKRCVGVVERAAEDFDFAEQLEEVEWELEVLNVEELEERIAENAGAGKCIIQLLICKI